MSRYEEGEKSLQTMTEKFVQYAASSVVETHTHSNNRSLNHDTGLWPKIKLTTANEHSSRPANVPQRDVPTNRFLSTHTHTVTNITILCCMCRD